MRVSAAAGTRLPGLQIPTVNSAAAARGSIHDDETARELGYAGGLVPGTTVLGYMTRLMHEAYGADWLRSGRFHGRLRLPTYAGVAITVDGTVVEEPSPANGGRVIVELRVLDPGGRATAFASASCLVTAA